MNVYPITNDSEYSYPLHMTGYASTLPTEEERDIGSELRAIYKEVTGQDAPIPQKARIGFV